MAVYRLFSLFDCIVLNFDCSVGYLLQLAVYITSVEITYMCNVLVSSCKTCLFTSRFANSSPAILWLVLQCIEVGTD